MKKIRLFQYFLPKKLSKELLLIAQLVLMELFAIAVMFPVDTWYQQYRSIKQAYGNDYSQILFFNPGNDHIGSDTEVLHQLMKELGATNGIDDITYTARGTAYVPTGNKVIDSHTGQESDEFLGANLFLYHQPVFEDLLVNSCSNVLTTQVSDEEIIRILISPSLASAIPIGTSTEIYFPQENINYLCVVIGILEEDTFLPASRRFGSYPSMDHVGVSFHNINMGFIVAESDSQKFWNTKGDGSCIVSLDASTDVEEILLDVNMNFDGWGEFYSLKDIEKKAFINCISVNRMYLFEFLLLALISLFGYGGYLFLSAYQEQRKFSIFHILGMTRKNLIVYQCIKGMMNIVISLFIAFLLSPWFQSSVLSEKSVGIGSISILFCVALLLSIMIGSLLAAFRLTKYATTISVYKGGD